MTAKSVIIESKENSSNIVKVDGEAKFHLCRCGASNNKPYCDGAHKNIGFKAPRAEIRII